MKLLRESECEHYSPSFARTLLVFETFQYAEGESENKLADLLKKFEEHCNPRQNTIYERYRSQCRNHEAGETASHYLTELRHAAIPQILRPVG